MKVEARPLQEREGTRRDRAIVMIVRLRSATALVVSTGLLILPMAALYCDASDAASMACCKDDMANCNRVGKTQDCCRNSVANHETVPNLVKARRLDRPATVSPDFALAMTTPPVAALRPASRLAASHLIGPAAPPPALTSVLRL